MQQKAQKRLPELKIPQSGYSFDDDPVLVLAAPKNAAYTNLPR